MGSKIDYKMMREVDNLTLWDAIIGDSSRKLNYILNKQERQIKRKRKKDYEFMFGMKWPKNLSDTIQFGVAERRNNIIKDQTPDLLSEYLYYEEPPNLEVLKEAGKNIIKDL